MHNHKGETFGSEGLAHLTRFSEEISSMLTPKITSVVLQHVNGAVSLVEGITFAVVAEIDMAERDLPLTGRVCVFNINTAFTQEGDDVFEVEHIDSAISFMEAMSEHYDVFVINTLSTLVSVQEASASLEKASYKGVLTNMVKIHQSLIKIKKPCVITNHIMNGEVYLGDLIKRFAQDTVIL